MSNINKSDLEALNRAITGIVYNNFGSVCMEVLVRREKNENIVTLKVWDKPMASVDKKLVISDDFLYEGLHDTIYKIENFVVHRGDE